MKYRTKELKFSIYFFLLFFLFTCLHKLNTLFSKIFTLDIQSFFSFSLLSFPIFFLFLSVFFLNRDRSTLRLKNSIYVNLILGYVIFLFIRGLYFGNHLPIMINEIYTALIIFFSYKLSSNPYIINFFRSYFRNVFFVLTFFVLIATNYDAFEYDEIVFNNQIDHSINTLSEGYNILSILDFWPFLFIISLFDINQLKSKRINFNYFKFLIVLLPFIIYLSFNFYFLKRAPSARAITYLLFVFFLLQFRTHFFRHFFKNILYLVIIIVFTYLIIPEKLNDRFRNSDNERYTELYNMISQQSNLEILFGKGLGGEYNVLDGQVVERINNLNNNVKSTLHVGVGDTYLKGGVLFFLLIFFHFSAILIKSLKNLRLLNTQQFVSLSFLLVFILFRIIEGGLTTGSIFNAFCYGFSFGTLDNILLIKKKNND